MDLYVFKMNIFLTITEIMILAPLKPYILPLLEHFLTLKTQILGMDYLYHLKWPIEVRS